MPSFLFIDTNVFLHYQPILQIDWFDLLKVQKITIIIPTVVLRELEKQKNENSVSRIRKRASEALRILEEMFGDDQEVVVTENLSIRLLTGIPKIKLEDYQLDEKIQDHILIAHVIGFKNENPSSDIYLASADTSLKLEARTHKLKTITPSDKYKIPNDLDEYEKKIKKMELQIAEEKDNKPDLKILFSNGQEVETFFIKKSFILSEEELSRKMVAINRDNKKIEKNVNNPQLGQGALTFMQLMGIPELTMREENVISYNKELDSFFDAYEKHLKTDYVNYENFVRRTIALNLIIQNYGGSPAKDVDIYLHFPDGFEMFRKNEYPEKPKAPSAPSKRSPFGTFGSTFPEVILRPNVSALSQLPLKNPNVSSPKIKRTNSYEVNIHVQNLKHKLLENFKTMFIVFDSFDKPKSFEIEYRIVAGNIPKEIEGKLLVKIEKEND